MITLFRFVLFMIGIAGLAYALWVWPFQGITAIWLPLCVGGTCLVMFKAFAEAPRGKGPVPIPVVRWQRIIRAEDIYETDINPCHFYIEIAGTQHYSAAVRTCKPGDLLWPVRERDNAHDSNAVALVTSAREKVGYLPRFRAEQVAMLMDAGHTYHGRVRRIMVDDDGVVSIELEAWRVGEHLSEAELKKLESLKARDEEDSYQYQKDEDEENGLGQNSGVWRDQNRRTRPKSRR